MLGNPSEGAIEAVHPPTVSLVTASWSGDLDQFRILVSSLKRSQLAGVKHTTVVQSEDLELFSSLLVGSPDASLTELFSTEEVLPPLVEHKRLQSLGYQKRAGSHLTRLCGSLTRVLGWPDWPRYTGWHVQQISKLAMAALADTDYVLVIDSDVIVTPAADLTGILSHDGIVCFSSRKPLSEFKGKTRKWVLQADALLRTTPMDKGTYDAYFDTPFLLHVKTVRAMFAWLEHTYKQPWWQVLLAQPPRRWSEFATYRLFLERCSESRPDREVTWLAPQMMHYIYDASDPAQLLSALQKSWLDPAIQFITVHSQSSGRQRWRADSYVTELSAMLS